MGDFWSKSLSLILAYLYMLLDLYSFDNFCCLNFFLRFFGLFEPAYSVFTLNLSMCVDISTNMKNYKIKFKIIIIIFLLFCFIRFQVSCVRCQVSYVMCNVSQQFSTISEQKLNTLRPMSDHNLSLRNFFISD